MLRSSAGKIIANSRRFFKVELNTRTTQGTCDGNLETSRSISNFAEIYPDFMQSTVWNRRINLKERLEHQDMLERRMNIDIPEFYVGSIVAVTSSDRNLGSKDHRFVGICIRREKNGLLHQFTLRNTIDKIGVEVLYDLYNPTIKKIETLKLEKRLDTDLSYLVDALPEYSTFDFHMESQAHPSGTPIPLNELKVKLTKPPWTRRWEISNYQGIEDSWTHATPWFKRKLSRTLVNDYEKYDLVEKYRAESTIEHEFVIQSQIHRFEKERHAAGLTRRRILRSASAYK